MPNKTQNQDICVNTRSSTIQRTKASSLALLRISAIGIMLSKELGNRYYCERNENDELLNAICS